MTNKKGISETGKNSFCLVVEEYRSAFPDPIITREGEELEVIPRETDWPGWVWCVRENGNGGWVPTNYIQLNLNSCRMLRDYDATELTVKVDDKLTILAEESGWAYCKTGDNKIGWVPLKNVRKF